MNRRTLMAATGGIVAGGLVSKSATASNGTNDEYEVWALDQSANNNIHIYTPGSEEGEFDEEDTINLDGHDIERPHMIDFSTGDEYAVVANTVSGNIAIIDTANRDVIEVLDTGPGSHFGGFSPDDTYIHVDVIGESEIVRVDADLEDEEFEIVDEIEIDEEIDGLTEEDGSPVCHEFDNKGRSIHTLGPSYHQAGVVIVDHDEFEVVEAWDGEALPANCGTMPHPTKNKFYLTAGLASDPDNGEEGVGEYFVLHTPPGRGSQRGQGRGTRIHRESVSTEGIDAHGIWPVESRDEMWIVNRETNDGVIVDLNNNKVKETIDTFGPADSEDPEDSDAPDILWSSPDDQYMFGTLRGPNPLSGDPHAATGVNPGFAVWDIESRERVATIQPAVDDEDADFHGIGVRKL